MVPLIKQSVSFLLLLLLLLVPELAITTSLATISSSWTITDENSTDHPPGQRFMGGGEDLPSQILTKLRRPIRHLSGPAAERQPTTIMGLKAELIHFRHSTSAAAAAGKTNSSHIPMDIKRSLARARNLKASNRLREGGARGSAHSSGSEDRLAGMQTDLTSGAPFEYLMKISIGTPPQHLVAVADTGSDLVWIQCTPPVLSCDICFDPGEEDNHFFQPTRSKTFSKLSCKSKPCQHFTAQYGDWVSCSSGCEYSYFYADNSSTTGDLTADTLHMKTSTSVEDVFTASVHNFSFGCGQNEYSTSMLYANANGVVGLGRGPLSFPSQLGAHFGRKFSYCLVDRKKSSVQSSPILFGDFAVPRIPGVQYTPFIDNLEYPTYYYIGLEKIEVDDEILDIPAGTFDLSSDIDNPGDGGTVIDSGTTYTQLVAPAYTTLLEALSSKIFYERVIGYFDFCYDVTWIPTDLIIAPTISLHFHGGAKFNLPFTNSFILVQGDPVQGKTTMCLAMNNSTDLGFSIIGNYQQSNFHIVYDLEEKRLGFVPRQCT